jgi:hypothetical protein
MKRWNRFLGTFLRILVIGIIIGALGSLIGGLITRTNPAFGWLPGVLVGFEISYPVGLIIGILLVKLVFHFPGALLLGIAGIIVGIGITVALGFTFTNDNQFPYLIACLILAAPILAAAGFQLKEKPAVNNNIIK